MRIKTYSTIQNALSHEQNYCCDKMKEMHDRDIIDFFINDHHNVYPLPVKTTFKIEYFDPQFPGDEKSERLEIKFCPFCGEKIE